MLWTVISYFHLPVGQYEGPMYKSSFQYLASLPASLTVITLIQRGKSWNSGRVLDSPAPISSWSSVVKASLCINGGGCPLSSTSFKSPGIWLARCSSVEEFAGINLVVVVTELPIPISSHDISSLWQGSLLSVDYLPQSLSIIFWYKCFPQ